MVNVLRLAFIFVWLGLGFQPWFDGSGPWSSTALAAPLQTNEDYIQTTLERSDLDISDIDLVFVHVFATLPDLVKVYPTENYYYFRFHHNGVPYAGNFRLDASDRDKGVINFAYFPANSGWRQDEDLNFKSYSSKHGVIVFRQSALTYKVSVGEKTVVFKLNDLSGVGPPDGLLDRDERYLGPVFDESGIQFFLVFNQRLKLFHYILNETDGVPDELYPSPVTDRIVLGRRTGFAWYRDHYINRKILIGVHQQNVLVNNYLDGPFDQLPDNFIKGNELREAMVAAGLANLTEIDRFGILPGGQDRILIKPYLTYSFVEDLEVFSDCAKDRDLARELYPECFVLMDPVDVKEDEAEDLETKPYDQGRASTEPTTRGGLGEGDPVAVKANKLQIPRPSDARLSVTTNQQFVEELLREASVSTNNIDEVFAGVFNQLSPVVQVYPTENYYYFEFIDGGISWSGNFRLAVEDRDAGKLHFTYYPTFTLWRRDMIDQYKIFSQADNVVVTKLSPLKYQVSYGDKTVIFELNDLSVTTPPAKLISPQETYIGPVFDESGLQFLLVYNSTSKVFHYILNEDTQVADELYISNVSPHIRIGRRTGFAFYQDKNRNRKILIGVYIENSNVNNWLDGPFDQLPDNFIKGDVLRDALIDFAPNLKGRIDRYGAWPDQESRYLIGPYDYYTVPEDLAVFDQCASNPELQDKDYYSCFQIEDEAR